MTARPRTRNRFVLRRLHRRAVEGGIAILLTALLASAGQAQSPNLRDLLKSFLRQGIVLAPPEEGIDHSAHFIGEDSPQFIALNSLNEEIGRQISNVPLSSSAGGFAYVIDPELGMPVRPTQSFGPIYAERALTVGKGRYNIGINRSQFTFDELDGLNLRNGDLDLVFLHQDVGEIGELDVLAEGDIIAADLFLRIETQITSFVGTFGVSDQFDVGLVVPLVENELRFTADAHLERLSTVDQPNIHQFPDGSSETVIESAASASGLGDIVLRGKYRFVGAESPASIAAAADFRFPTGDEADLLGAGIYQAKGSLIASMNWPRFSPHVNLGVGLSDDENSSSEIDYVVGFDWAVDPKLTVAFDMLGRYVPEVNTATESTFEHSYLDPGDPSVIQRITLPVLEQVEDDSRNRIDLAAGFKVNVFGNVLLNASGLVALSEDGLKDDFSGLIGVDYSF